MENLKMFGIYAGSVALLSFAAYLLSLNTVKHKLFLDLPIASTTTSIASKTRSIILNKPDTTTASTTATSSATSTTQVPVLKTATDTNSRFTFQYGDKFSGQYVSVIDWPPQVQTLEQKYNCTEAGNIFDRTGRTTERKIGEQNFCVTNIENKVDTKIINRFAYITEISTTSIAIFTFGIQREDCNNLTGDQKNYCVGEEQSYIPDNSVFEIFKTLKKI